MLSYHSEYRPSYISYFRSKLYFSLEEMYLPLLFFFFFSLLSCLPCILEPPSLLSFLYPTSSCLNIQCGFGHEMVQREFCVPEIPERHSYSPEVGREMFAVLVDSGDVLSTFMLTILFTFPSPLESSVYAFILCPFHADLCVRD